MDVFQTSHQLISEQLAVTSSQLSTPNQRLQVSVQQLLDSIETLAPVRASVWILNGAMKDDHILVVKLSQETSLMPICYGVDNEAFDDDSAVCFCVAGIKEGATCSAADWTNVLVTGLRGCSDLGNVCMVLLPSRIGHSL